MSILAILLTIFGLVLFETISSVDNAIINAEVLSTMSAKAKKWFLFWGLLIAVFLLRGALPWAIVWLTNPFLGPWGALTAALSSDPAVALAIERSSHVLLTGGGVFLIFLFFHWLFLEPKEFGLSGEKFFQRQGVWFYAVVSIILAIVVWFSINANPVMAFGAVVGSTSFFIIHGFRQTAEKSEKDLLYSTKSDLAKILFLEVIDATFSIDGVIGSFAYTLSVPLILIGNGIGAIIVRQLTLSNIERIKRYTFLKNGAMYSILFLGVIMVLDAFSFNIPAWLSPIVTVIIVWYFFLKSKAAFDPRG